MSALPGRILTIGFTRLTIRYYRLTSLYLCLKAVYAYHGMLEAKYIYDWRIENNL